MNKQHLFLNRARTGFFGEGIAQKIYDASQEGSTEDVLTQIFNDKKIDPTPILDYERGLDAQIPLNELMSYLRNESTAFLVGYIDKLKSSRNYRSKRLDREPLRAAQDVLESRLQETTDARDVPSTNN